MLQRWRMTVQGTVDASRAALVHGIAGNISGGKLENSQKFLIKITFY